MNNKRTLETLSKDELIRLMELQAKNWLALDGVWFQSVERKCGMDEAMTERFLHACQLCGLLETVAEATPPPARAQAAATPSGGLFGRLWRRLVE